MTARDTVDATIETEPLLEELANEVRAAQEALLATLHADPDGGLRPRAVMDSANQNWSNAVMSVAFFGLVRDGRVEVDEHMVARVSAA